MARIPIQKKDGTATPYFWSDAERAETGPRTVYKQTADGVKRMKNVQFDPAAKRIVKH